MRDNDLLDEELTPLQDEVQKHIKKLIKPLKEENELKVVLKTKLTKKEFKILNTWANSEPIEPLLERLNLTKERYEELSSKLIKKLNQEKLKQEMMI